MTTPGLEAAPWVPGSLTVLEPRLTFVRVVHARLILIDPEPAALDLRSGSVSENPSESNSGI